MIFDNGKCGILLEGDTNDVIDNDIYNHTYFSGALNISSSSNNIQGNRIHHNDIAIRIGHGAFSVNDNNIFENIINDNSEGIKIIFDCNGHYIYNNTFINNSPHATDPKANYWDSGYPPAGTGGNYWDDYMGVDLLSGPGQNMPGPDGFGDTWYYVDLIDSFDYYPLMDPWHRVHNVTQDRWYYFIQDAVDRAAPNDVIEAYSYTFYENVNVTKTLTIRNAIGETPILDGWDRGHGFYLEGIDDAVISGFTIQNCEHPDPRFENWYAGIFIKYTGSGDAHADRNIIDNNTIFDCDYGVYTLGWGSGGKIRNNQITNNTLLGTNKSGIHVKHSDFTIIEGNEVHNNFHIDTNHAGIAAIGSNFSIILNNDVSFNDSLGIFVQSSFTGIEKNMIFNNGKCGILLEGDSNVVFDNDIYNHTYFSGALNISASSNNIQGNRIHNNYIAIRIGHGAFSVNNNNIFENIINDNSEGIIIIFDCNDNYIYNNTFINNDPHASDPASNYWDSGYPPDGTGGNYWDDYDGPDIKSGPNQLSPGPDGFGDEVYIIDSNSIDHYPLMDPFHRVHNVTQDTWFYFIQDAVDAAIPNDVIEAYSYTFYENVNVTKTLTIRNAFGETPILDGWDRSHGFYLQGIDDATISGFTIQNCEHPIPTFYDWYAGIYIIYTGSSEAHADNNTIENNTLTDCDVGIHTLGWGSGGPIRDNKILFNNISYMNRAGIYTSYSDYSTIDNNTVQYTTNYSTAFAAIYTKSSHNSTVTNNFVLYNDSQGIFIQSSKTIISGNDIHDNGVCGLRIEGITNDIFDNTIYNHTHYSGGIALRAPDNYIYLNEIYDNYTGIRLEHPDTPVTDCYIFDNEIETNNTGVEIILTSVDNYIFHNNFISNTTQAVDANSNYWDYGYPQGGNYWDDFVDPHDDYEGENQDIVGNDGIVDKGLGNPGLNPYVIDGNSQDNYPLLNPWIP
jgi:parallel beta-helix repeat protein